MPTPDQILVDYGLQLQQFRKDLDEIKKGLKGTEKTAKETTDNASKEFDKLGTTVNGKLTSSFKQLGTAIVAAFTIRAVVNFTTQCINLARQAEEVTAAFNKLNNPALLGELRKAVQGTLSDVQLMQLAIKANNFKIPLKDLANAFAFAKLKADETGKSTEELAATIIESIGRNSSRALVQLGISQQQINEKVKETGSLYAGLTAIISETVSTATGDFDSASDKVDRLNASIANTKVEIGEKLLPVFAMLLDGVNKLIIGWDRIIKLIGGVDTQMMDLNKEAKTTFEEFKKRVDEEAKSLEERKDLARAYVSEIKNIIEANRQEASLIVLGKEQRIKEIKELVGDTKEARRTIKILEEDIAAINSRTSKQADTYNKLIKLINDYANVSEPVGQITEDNTIAFEKSNDALEKQADLIKENIAAVVKYVADIQKGFEKAGLKTTSELFTRNTPTQEDIDLLRMYTQQLNVMGDVSVDNTNRIREAATQRRDAEIAANSAIAQSSEELRNKQLSDAQMYLDFVSNTLSLINERFSSSTDYKISLLEKELEYGRITQEQFDQESKILKSKEAKRDKQFAIFDITINTARAIVAALAEANPVLAALATATGALQLGLVISEPVPQFKKGGFPKGKNAIVQVNEEGQEFIVNAKATRQYTEALKAMNKGTFEQYIKNSYKTDQSMTWDDYRLQLAIYKLGHIQKEVGSTIVQAIKEHRKPHRY